MLKLLPVHCFCRVLSVALCTAGSECSEIAFWPLLDILLDWIFDGTPFVVKYVYLAATSTYATVTSVMEEWAT
jgi:hypothetical protein